MGRAPCCDKANVKKGPWSPEEDDTLKSYIEKHGTGGNWIALPQKIGLRRCGKSCRLRWLNYLRPNIKHGGFSEEEDNLICSLYISIGSRWSIIAAQLPGRTDNDIKNYWNTRLKKKLLGKQRKERCARKASSLKKGAESSMAPQLDNQVPYWPEIPMPATLPIPYSNQEQRLNNHNSLRKMLIKLGGRFSDDDQQISNGMNIQYPINNMNSSAPMDELNNPTTQFAYNMDGVGLDMVQGQSSSFPVGLDEMVYRNPERLDGLEFLYREATTSGESSIGWGDIGGSMINPLVASDYVGVNQDQYGIIQQSDFNRDLSYQELQYS